jgi:hypothetical protein
VAIPKLSDEICQSLIELIEDNFTGEVHFEGGQIVKVVTVKDFR